MNDTGGSAFPQSGSTDPNGNFTYPEFGMSLRDWFAAMALAGIGTWTPPHGGEQLQSRKAQVARASFAYEQADAMLAVSKEAQK